MAYSELPIETAAVCDLHLDVGNYRFPVDQPTESAAMNYLFAAHDVMDVVRIILRDGYIDNELPFVVRERRRMVILEGNRRLSALRALLDPSLVPSFQTELERLLRRYALEAADLPEKIRVIRFPNRDAAAPVLARLHIGESKKAWSLDEQAKFVLAQVTDGVTVDFLKEQFPAIKDVVRLIRMGHVREMLRAVTFDDPTLNEYASSDRLAMSAFEYAYRNADIQSSLGIAFDNSGNLTRRPSSPEHLAALARLLRGFRAGELNTRRGLKPGSQDFNNLLAEMHGEQTGGPRADGAGSANHDDPHESGRSNTPDNTTSGAPPSSESQAPGPTAVGSQGGSTQPEQGQGSRRGPNNPQTKKYLDFSTIDETHLPLPLKHRIRELRRIDVTDFPAAAAMLMRSLIEAATKEHYGFGSGKGETRMLKAVMTKVTEDYGMDGKLAHAISTINRTGRGSSTTPGTGEWFNLISHSVDIDVDARQVHEAWRVVFPLIRFLLGQRSSTTRSP
jgi:hypothetical protein